MAGKAEQAERVRDLKAQLGGVDAQEMSGIQFQMISEGREPVTIYSTEDGRPVTIPMYMLPQVMDRRREDGEYRFVSEKARAPEYKMGEIVCFLHVDAPERATIEEIGLGAIKCRKHTLPSQHAWRMHGKNRHKQEWAAYQEHLKGEKEAKQEQRQDKQLEATLTIARGGQVAVATPPGECDVCGRTGFKNVGAHKYRVHKEG